MNIEAVEEVYSNSNKIILDSEGSGNLLYLPIDRLLASGGTTPPILDDRTRSSDPSTLLPTQDMNANDDPRDRRTRQ